MENAERILIVDSYPDNAESLALLLGGDGRQIEVATNGQHAIARAMGWRPDLIVLDLGLPDVCGEDVVEALRAGGSTAYIVAYSGFHKREAKARAAGCNAFVLKPKLDALLAIVQAIGREKATA
jgi:two-component system KDP operon response regulator KdpE